MSIVLFLAILLLLVLVHEFGHFIVAKRSGIRVDEFAFGFPPRLFSVKKGETTYAFNALPLGGYVKIYGEDPSDVVAEDRKRSFTAQPRIIQSMVILAGVMFNLLLAWVLLSATFMIGIPATNESVVPYVVRDPKLTITEVVPESPAAEAGLQPGDRILGLSEGEYRLPASVPDEVIAFVGPRAGHEVVLSYRRADVEHFATVIPRVGIVSDRAAIGISMDMVGVLRLSPIDALVVGAQKTLDYTRLTALGILDFFKGIFFGNANFGEVTGPVGIVRAVGDAAHVGIANLLMFTALISINLAVINVLPFPALDGGRFVFILIEAVTRRPLPAQVSNTLNLIGFGLLLLLMVVVTYHDVTKLF